MARNTIPMTIAGFSTFIHTCMTLFMTYALIKIILIILKADDGNSTVVVAGGFGITILVISLLLEIAVLIVSIYLILAVQRERHQFIAPWVYLTGIYTILSFIGLIKGSNALDAAFAIKVIIIILHAAMWYPIFRYWRDLKTGRSTNSQQNSRHDICYNAQTHGGLCDTGPGTGRNYYPPSGNRPQIGTEACYYPPQNYAAEQRQPSCNLQLTSASYSKYMKASAEGPHNPPIFLTF